MSQPIPAVTAYFDDIRLSLGVGVPETSGYSALRDFLHAVGESLKPKIAPVIHPKNKGVRTGKGQRGTTILLKFPPATPMQ